MKSISSYNLSESVLTECYGHDTHSDFCDRQLVIKVIVSGPKRVMIFVAFPWFSNCFEHWKLSEGMLSRTRKKMIEYMFVTTII